VPPAPYERRFPSLAVSPGKESLWRDYKCVHGREVLVDELEAIASDSEDGCAVQQIELELRLGELDAVIERARFGELVEREELKPANVDPELWEIRLRISARQVRIYHAEPQDYKDLMVGLRAHFKWLEGNKTEIERRQNVEMSKAAERFHKGAERDWLSGPADPSGCELGGPC
jgi:hypothetical protein